MKELYSAKPPEHVKKYNGMETKWMQSENACTAQEEEGVL